MAPTNVIQNCSNTCKNRHDIGQAPAQNTEAPGTRMLIADTVALARVPVVLADPGNPLGCPHCDLIDRQNRRTQSAFWRIG